VHGRGVLRHLVTRIYFPDEAAANENDWVLSQVEPARRSTLIASADGPVLHFDIHLQGDQETVFFAL
jgi:protocatechuate 3,4-dioxygenase alpha subunit